MARAHFVSPREREKEFEKKIERKITNETLTQSKIDKPIRGPSEIGNVIEWCKRLMMVLISFRQERLQINQIFAQVRMKNRTVPRSS